MMSRRRCLASILLALATVPAGSFLRAEEPTEPIVADLEAKAAAVKSYRADLTITMNMVGQKIKMQGKLLFKKPNRTRMETVMDMGAMKMEQRIISDGKMVWTYQPTMKMVTKIDLKRVLAETKDASGAQKTNDLSKPFQGFQRESISQPRTEQLDGSKVYVFEGLPKKSQMPKTFFAPAKMQVSVGADDGLLRKMILFNEEGKEMMSQSYANTELNVEVADSEFEFTPPEGAQVMDMTEGAINMIKQMKGKEQQ